MLSCDCEESAERAKEGDSSSNKDAVINVINNKFSLLSFMICPWLMFVILLTFSR